MDKQIRQFVKKIRFRLTKQEIINWLQITLLIGAAAELLISAVSLLIPFYYAPHIEILVLVLSIMSGIILGICHTPDMMKSALMADGKGNKERISTALSLAGSSNPYAELQKRDALASVAGFQARKEFPLHLSVKRLIPFLLLVILFAGSCFMDSPVRRRAQEAHEVQEKAKEVIAAVEKVEKELKENTGLSETELSELTEQLELSKKELSQAETQAELLKAQERLTQKLETAGNQTENQTLADAMQKAAQSSQAQQMKSREEMMKEAQKALEQAEDGSKEEKENAYEKLSDLASALGDEQLQNAADNYQDSNYSGADYAAAKSALNQAISQANENSALANNSSSNQANGTDNSDPSATTSNNNSSSDSKDGKENSSNNESQGQEGSSQQGQGQGNTSNTGESNGQGNSSGEGSGGQGSGGQDSGGQNGGTGIASGGGWNYGSKNGQEGAAKVNESITVPEGELGDDDNLTGQANENDSSIYVKSDQSQTWAGNKVSYGSVSGEYKEKAYQKLDGASYPDKLKDQIRNYFDGLN